MAFLDENGVAQLWAAVKDRLAGAFDSVEFNVAQQAANLVSGDSIATAFGKLAKNYSSLLTSISDLNTSLGNRISEVNTSLTNQINTKLNKSDVLANYTTTATGKALDASLGPAIKAKMDLADTLNTKVTQLTDSLIVTGITSDALSGEDGSVIERIPKNTSQWIYFPAQLSGYTPIGIVGFYIYSYATGETSYYSHVNIFNIRPNLANAAANLPTNISMAIVTGSDGDWVKPRAFLNVLWKKNA